MVKTISVLLLLIFSAHSSFAAYRLRDAVAKKYVDSILALMSYSAIPDLASSSLSIDSAQTGNPSILMTQLGGGATMSESVPVYLEGAIAYSRYDPIFLVTDGTDTRELPFRWNSGTLQGGIGGDYKIAENWVIRPILNFSAGVIVSDLEVGTAVIGARLELEDDFLDGGSMTVGGLGGSMMLDYEFHSPDLHDIDFELRYTFMHLQSMGGSTSVKGYSDSSTSSMYYRWRAPIADWVALQKPFRYVLESSLSYYAGDQAGILGFDTLGSLGAGIELDSSAYNVFVTRTRLVGRYMFGPGVRGYSFGFACSF